MRQIGPEGYKEIIAVLGAGAWGTALAVVLARNGCGVNLWSKFAEEVQILQKNRANPHCLPGITLPENIHVDANLADAVANASMILLAVPSQVFREILGEVKPFIRGRSKIGLAWGTKGFDTHAKLLHEAVCEIIGDIAMAAISGPTFALEVAKGLPTAVTVASNEMDFAKKLAGYLHNETFRVYTSCDLIGAQVGGAVKNVLAIATGVSDGMGFGANTRCALITRGLAELTRLGIAFGGKMDTFMGLAGLGDLVLTCTDDQSRNRRFGLAIGKGYDRGVAEKDIGQVIEGIANAKLVYNLAHKKKIEMPISEQVYRVLYENVSPKQAVTALLQREQKGEIG